MLRQDGIRCRRADGFDRQGGVFGGIPGQGMVSAMAPPPPKPAAPSRIKQGGNVTAASILNQTRPLYPPLARQARIQGNVVLHAIIDKDGKVVDRVMIDKRSGRIRSLY